MKKLLTLIIGLTLVFSSVNALSVNQFYPAIGKYSHFETYMLQNNGSIQLFPNSPQTCNSTSNVGSFYFDGSDFYRCKGTGWLDFAGTTYSASTGLSLSGSAFSVLLGYRLPQGCTDGYIPYWNSTNSDWRCKVDEGAGSDTTCDGSSCNVANTGTLDGYEASALLDNTDTQLTEEQVEDFIGDGFSGNTETRISVTYQDADGTFDFVVDDMNDDNPEASEVLWSDLTDQGTFVDNKVCTYSSGTGYLSCNSDFTVDTDCDGSSCNVANTGTLDGYEASALLDNTDTQLTEGQVEGMIFDDDNSANLNMSGYNITGVDCMFFVSGGKICDIS